MDHTVIRVERLGRLLDRFETIDEMSDEVWTEVMAKACKRATMMPGRGHLARLNRLAADGAWVDAALALINVELAGWKVRRIVYDDGEWHCALSRERYLPAWLDDAVEVSHHDLAVALVKAALEALCEPALMMRSPGRAPYIPAEDHHYISCDNF
jgi:hypothetical protein